MAEARLDTTLTVSDCNIGIAIYQNGIAIKRILQGIIRRKVFLTPKIVATNSGNDKAKHRKNSVFKSISSEAKNKQDKIAIKGNRYRFGGLISLRWF
jgi:hypothetical protein